MLPRETYLECCSFLDEALSTSGNHTRSEGQVPLFMCWVCPTVAFQCRHEVFLLIQPNMKGNHFCVQIKPFYCPGSSNRVLGYCAWRMEGPIQSLGGRSLNYKSCRKPEFCKPEPFFSRCRKYSFVFPESV